MGGQTRIQTQLVGCVWIRMSDEDDGDEVGHLTELRHVRTNEGPRTMLATTMDYRAVKSITVAPVAVAVIVPLLMEHWTFPVAPASSCAIIVIVST